MTRSAGQALEKMGRRFEVAPYVEHLQPSTRAIAYQKSVPSTSAAAFIAPSATVMGKVELGVGASVWYGATIRGDVNTISIGDRSVVGEGAVVHCAGLRSNYPTRIGKNVVIGANAVAHGCTLEDDCVVGAGAQVLDGATVKRGAMVAAGAVVSSGKTVPSGELWAGVPARMVRPLSQEELSALTAGTEVESFLALAQAHTEETSKSWEQVQADEEDRADRNRRSPHYFQPLNRDDSEFAQGLVTGQAYPGRVFDSPLNK